MACSKNIYAAKKKKKSTCMLNSVFFVFNYNALLIGRIIASWFNQVGTLETPYRRGGTDESVLKNIWKYPVLSRAINRSTELKTITDNIEGVVIKKFKGVCEVLVGLWSFISSAPGVPPTQACTSFCSWKILHLASALYFPSLFPMCHLYCFSEEEMLEEGCSIRDKIEGFSE